MNASLSGLTQMALAPLAGQDDAGDKLILSSQMKTVAPSLHVSRWYGYGRSVEGQTDWQTDSVGMW